MPGPLDHSPADIARYGLIELSLGVLPENSGDWPIFAGTLVNLPDNAILCYDTEGTKHGRVMQGETQKHHGVQVLVRGATDPVSQSKALAIATALDNAYQTVVTIDSSSYRIHSFNLASGPFFLGRERDGGERYLTSINYLVSVRQLS